MLASRAGSTTSLTAKWAVGRSSGPPERSAEGGYCLPPTALESAIQIALRNDPTDYGETATG
eukprot:8608448-Pyramimonas_sp.AAC.1